MPFYGGGGPPIHFYANFWTLSKTAFLGVLRYGTCTSGCAMVDYRDLIFFLGVGLVALFRKRVFWVLFDFAFYKKMLGPLFRNQRAIPYPKN